MVTQPTRTNHTKLEVDPAILAVIESANVPLRSPKPVLPSPAIPGTLSALEGVKGLVAIARRGMAYSAEYRAKHGDVYRVSLAGIPMVVVWDADEIHRITRNEEGIFSAPLGWNIAMFDGLDPRAGNTGTLSSLDFDDHRTARKLVQPAFTMKAIDGYLDAADRSFTEAVGRWLARGHVSFKAEVRTLLGKVAGEIFTGIRDPELMAKVDRALSDFWHGFVVVTRNPWLSPGFRKARKGLAYLIDTFLALVPERRKTGGDDLFSRMCAVADTDGLGDEAIVRVFISIMFGAFDTTSAAMASMAYLLAKHPDWQDRLRDEARAVPEGAFDAAATKGMKAHEWVWKETLRLMPVAGYVPRTTLGATKIAGYDIAAGTMVMPMVGGIGLHPKWWKEPTRFDPERFSPERAEDRQHPGIYNPFGAGAHACVGMQLANMEMKAFWHRMLRTCRFRLAKPYEGRHTFRPFGMVSGDVALTLEPLTRRAGSSS